MLNSKSRWDALSRQALDSAEKLFRDGDFRGCANRAYYSAYQAATGACLGQNASFAQGRNNPSHDQLPDLIKNNGIISIDGRRRINKSLRSLRRTREDADYRPGATVDKVLAQDCLHRAALVLNLLEVNRDEETK